MHNKEVMPRVTDDEALLTTEQAATYLNTDRSNVRRWAISGRLQAVGKAGRGWRFRRSDLDAFLQAPATDEG